MNNFRSEKNRLETEEEQLGDAIRRANDVIESTNEVELKLRTLRKSLGGS